MFDEAGREKPPKNDLLVKVATSLAAWSQNNSSSFERTYG